jgi:hypothetical protein
MITSVKAKRIKGVSVEYYENLYQSKVSAYKRLYERLQEVGMVAFKAQSYFSTFYVVRRIYFVKKLNEFTDPSVYTFSKPNVKYDLYPGYYKYLDEDYQEKDYLYENMGSFYIPFGAERLEKIGMYKEEISLVERKMAEVRRITLELLIQLQDFRNYVLYWTYNPEFSIVSTSADGQFLKLYLFDRDVCKLYRQDGTAFSVDCEGLKFWVGDGGKELNGRLGIARPKFYVSNYSIERYFPRKRPKRVVGVRGKLSLDFHIGEPDFDFESGVLQITNGIETVYYKMNYGVIPKTRPRLKVVKRVFRGYREST